MDGAIEQTMPERQELRFSEELADFVNKEFERRQTERKPYELQWRLNMEFLNGNQYLDIDAETMTIQDVPRIYWYQEREVFNQLSTIAETRIARLSRQKPIMKVRPATNDQADLSAARVSSMLLHSTWHDEEMDKKYDKFIAWLETCGTSFFVVNWNKSKGRILEQQETEKDPHEMEDVKKELEKEAPNMMDDPFRSAVKRIVLREGDIDTDVASPFEIYPDNSHGDFDDTRSVIRARAYHIHDIEDTWGVKVEAERVDVATLQEAGSGMGGLGYSVGAFRYSTRKLERHALVKEYYEIPSIRYPHGRFIVVCNDKTLYAGVLPHMIGKDQEADFPFVRAVSIEVVGSFWGKSVIERCIPIQRRYNALRNRKAEYLNLVTIGQWYAPDGTVEDESVLNNEPGNIIRYRAGTGERPEPVQYPSLPHSFEAEEQTLLRELTAISGVSELSRYSEAPSGVKSGVALSIANEQDDTRISLTAGQLEQASISLGKKWLRMYRQYAQEPRVIRYVGANSEIDVLHWNASDLRSDDVIVDNSSALSETPAQRRQMVFDLLGTGMFNRDESNPFSQEGIRKILEMLELGHWEGGIHEDEEMQESKAKRENRKLLEGILLPINDYDNDDTHIREHYRFMMSHEYEELMLTPQGKYIDMIFKQHVGLHQQRLQQIQMQQMMAQMGMPMAPVATEEETEEEDGEPLSQAGVEILDGGDAEIS
jgi:hypothetical protein